MTQSDLGRKCNITPNIVSDFEAGTAPMNQDTLKKMEKALGIYLTGSNIGELKQFGPKKK
jgi:ribosome-binding protein aMBF1 (putative translation factor)